MKSIRHRVHIYGGMTGLGVSVIIFLFINTVIHGYSVSGELMFISVAALIAASLYVREYSRLKTALLIMENQILHIRPVVVDAQERGKEMKGSPTKDMEVYVSCFGILLDSRIIRFNQDGIHLKAVEIEQDYITFTYGTDKRLQSIRLLWARIEKGELAKIQERFRYETGIVPTIVS